jgi:ABC-2 type transport system permease protein
MSGASAIARRTFADARTRTFSFALLFAFAAYVQVTAFREGYPTLEDRLQLARSFGDNNAVRLLYGEPHDLLSVGGYVSWRVGGSIAIFAAVWGLLGAVRAMRAEEEAGRAELVLAGVVSRRKAVLSQLAAIGAGAAILWLALFAALAGAELPAGDSAYLALAVLSPLPVFVGVGAVASQLAPTRRLATELSTGVLAVAFALRAIADTSSGGADWLRWASPLGWAEELRPFADPQPIVLLLPALAGLLLLVVAGMLAVRRDIGSGLLPARDTRAPRLALLGSPAAQTLRSEGASLAVWLVAAGAFAFLMGVLSDTVASALSEDLRQQLEKLGTESVATPSGFLGFTFIFFVLVVSVFCCAQLSAARREEADQQLETMLALPVGRLRWLAGRLLLAAGGAAAVALAAGVLAWAGATTQGADVSLADMLGAGANCLPAALLFLGLGTLAFALVPRASAGIAYGLVALAFVWDTFGSLLEVPDWLLALSPFHNVGLVPAEPFEAAAAAIMLAIAAAAALAGASAFRRRDLTAT